MMNIRPVSDLRNRYPDVENDVLSSGNPVFLTKNGYGSMVLMSLEMYASLTEDLETKLLEADSEAENTDIRYTPEEVFTRVRKRING